MKCHDPKKKQFPPAALDEELLADVTGGTEDPEAEVLQYMLNSAEEDVQIVTGPVGAFTVE